MSICVDSSDNKVRSDIVIKSIHIRRYAGNPRYTIRFWIIKYVSLESIIFSSNLDAALSLKVFSIFLLTWMLYHPLKFFSIFYFVFILIILLT